MPFRSPIVANAPATAPPGESADFVHIAGEITRDLRQPNARVYYTDLLLSAVLGYGALALCASTNWLPVRLAAGLVSVLALYRALSFIHEITHMKRAGAPGFRLLWNLLIGAPLLTPSFVYEGVHNLHHAKSSYGTSADPEYLPLAGMGPLAVVLFVAAPVLAPIALLVRFALLAPLSLAYPPLRRIVTERFSALVINPAYRRKPPTGRFRASWLVWETAASVWALFLIVAAATSLFPRAELATFALVGAGVAVLNQARTAAAHLWLSDGRRIAVADQYLDSVNVPPPGLAAELWAPVGLRYHATHHLLPSIPYHNLPEAHRRLSSAPELARIYPGACHRGMIRLIVQLMGRRRFPVEQRPASAPALDELRRS